MDEPSTFEAAAWAFAAYCLLTPAGLDLAAFAVFEALPFAALALPLVVAAAAPVDVPPLLPPTVMI